MNRGFYKYWLVGGLMIATLAGRAQDDPAGLQSAFGRYEAMRVPEKVFVHTDKTFYLAGEIIWFKVYAVNGSTNIPSVLSKLAYVEVLNADDKPVLQAKISLDESSGNGSFLVPYSLASGNYRLRAYTRWMKNFSPDYFYEQSLTVVNTLRELSGSTTKKQPNYDIRFFPEGGNWVGGLPGRLAYKVVNNYGESVNYAGVIINHGGDTVATVASAKFGMGSIAFTPLSGEQYHAVISLPDTTMQMALPAVSSKGYAIQLENTDTGHLKLHVRATADQGNARVYLFAHSQQKVSSVQEGTLVNGEITFSLAKKDLAEGISQFTVFDANRQPVAERLYFQRPINSLAIGLATDKPEYTNREKVNLDVDAKDIWGKPMHANMSVSVFLVDSFEPAAENSINNYLLLGSELKGRIESPAFYFGAGPEAEMAADNLMLTQGWTRFAWKDVVGGQAPLFRYMPELEGQVIEGRILNKFSGQVAPRVEAYLSIPDSVYTFKSITSDAEGKFSVTVKDLHGLHDVVLQTNNKRDSIYKIELTNPYAEVSTSFQLPAFSLAGRKENELLKRSINTQAQNAYQTDAKLHTFYPLLKDTGAFYGAPDQRYYLDDYTRFITMDEVIREYVFPLKVRKHPGGSEFRVFNNAQKTVFEGDPLTLIDGIPVFAADKIMAMDPLKLKRIDIVEQRYFMGNTIFNGIVAINTYQGDLGGYTLDPGAIILEYEGLQQRREFYSPVYDTKEQVQSSIPDYRTQVYWSPDVRTTGSGRTQLAFYTPDLKGNFQVVLQGITKEGLSGSKTLSFRVN